jgi:hypothetical protein
MNKYKRYIVFAWDEYDNASPLPDFNESFSEKNKACDHAISQVTKWDDSFSAVLDTDSKEVIEKYCSFEHKDEYIDDGFTAVAMVEHQLCAEISAQVIFNSLKDK